MVARAYAFAALAAVAAYFAVPGRAQALAYCVIGVSAVAAFAVGVRRNRPRHATGWLLVGTGMLCSVTGDVLSYGSEFLGRPLPFPSDADVPYLAAHPLLVAGLLRVAGRLRSADGLVGIVDATIVVAAAAAAHWLLVDEPKLGVGGFVLVSLTPASRLASYRALAVGTVVLLVADTAYDVAPQTYTAGRWPDGFWLAS